MPLPKPYGNERLESWWKLGFSEKKKSQNSRI